MVCFSTRLYFVAYTEDSPPIADLEVPPDLCAEVWESRSGARPCLQGRGESGVAVPARLHHLGAAAQALPLPAVGGRCAMWCVLLRLQVGLPARQLAAACRRRGGAAASTAAQRHDPHNAALQGMAGIVVRLPPEQLRRSGTEGKRGPTWPGGVFARLAEGKDGDVLHDPDGLRIQLEPL